MACFTGRTRARAAGSTNGKEHEHRLRLHHAVWRCQDRPHDKNLERRTGLEGTRLAV